MRNKIGQLLAGLVLVGSLGFLGTQVVSAQEDTTTTTEAPSPDADGGQSDATDPRSDDVEGCDHGERGSRGSSGDADADAGDSSAEGTAL